jgi:hypothetical protein
VMVCGGGGGGGGGGVCVCGGGMLTHVQCEDNQLTIPDESPAPSDPATTANVVTDPSMAP